MADNDQPATPGPLRPRLADHVAARRHVVAGQEIVVLHDQRSGACARLGAREWAVLGCADGTRDLEGIMAAASLRGHRVGRADLGAFLGELDRAALLAEGPSSDEAPPEVEPRQEATLDVLASYALHCDGRGTCCRSYPTTQLTPGEAWRACTECPTALRGGFDEDRAFTPELGSSFRGARGRELARCVTMVDGRCAFLDPEGRCALHLGGGLTAKPLGCRHFPAVLVDDGEAIRVAPAPECACVLRSIGRTTGGEPLLPPGARTGADLDPGVFVRRLPSRVRLSADVGVPLAQYLGWWRGQSARWAGQWRRASLESTPAPASVDVPSVLWCLASVMQSEGFDDEGALEAAWRAGRPEPRELSRSVMALGRAIEARLEQWNVWRSSQDPILRVARAVLIATRQLGAHPDAGSVATSEAQHRAEAFTVHARLHAHGLADNLPLGAALRDQAVRLMVARTLPAALGRVTPSFASDPAADQPIALVEALLRGHGLWSYVEAP